jgi:hypothetical protein
VLFFLADLRGPVDRIRHCARALSSRLDPLALPPHRLHVPVADRDPLAMPIACISPLMSLGLGK